MPILELQQRMRELGRIRIGAKTSKGAPTKLDRFRVTSPSRPLLDAVAAAYGGQVTDWTPAGGTAQYEVLTDATALPVLVPPQPLTQWMELWSGGGCARRCDGRTNVLDDSPCACPDDQAERNAAAAQGRACKPTTRLNVVLRDVPGIGVWRLESHGWNAALELPQVVGFLAQATAAGTYLPASLGLVERTQRTPGQGVRRYMVPTIDVDATPSQLMAGGQSEVPAAALPDRVPLAAIEAPSGGAGAVRAATELVGAASIATDVRQVHELWAKAKADGLLTVKVPDADGLPCADLLAARGRKLKGTPANPSPALSVDDLWQQVVDVAADRGEGFDVDADYAKWSGGQMVAAATADQLAAYLAALRVPAAPVLDPANIPGSGWERAS